MRLTILTALTRPENLKTIAQSLKKAAHPKVEVHWLIHSDPKKEHIGGQKPKNDMLNSFTKDWFWILDDDTTVHPDIFKTLYENKNFDAVVVSQYRSPGDELIASHENVRVGGIDAGQVFVRRDKIDSERIPEEYDGDGKFLAKVLPRIRVKYINEPLSLYNTLR